MAAEPSSTPLVAINNPDLKRRHTATTYFPVRPKLYVMIKMCGMKTSHMLNVDNSVIKIHTIMLDLPSDNLIIRKAYFNLHERESKQLYCMTNSSVN